LSIQEVNFIALCCLNTAYEDRSRAFPEMRFLFRAKGKVNPEKNHRLPMISEACAPSGLSVSEGVSFKSL
jgi:hypothetical protein